MMLRGFVLSGLFLLSCTETDGSAESAPARTAPSVEEMPGSGSVKVIEPRLPYDPDITQVVMLGTGTPNAIPDRSGPSVAVVVGGQSYIVDCGPGVVRRAAAAFQRGVGALRPEKLTRLFITHLHSDHTAGYADLILTPWALDRPQPLLVYGPPGTRRMTDHLIEAYEEDIAVRIHGSQPVDETAGIVTATDVSPGAIYEDARMKVTAFAVKHGAWRHAYGYKLETRDRTVVISGDTTPVRSIVENCNGCDVLVHEVYSKEAFDRREPKWQVYHAASHTSTVQLAEIAAQAEPGLLVLYHQLLWGVTKERMLEEIRRGYNGKVAFANDLDVY